MKEQMPKNVELTGVNTSSKLNDVNPSLKGNISMPKDSSAEDLRIRQRNTPRRMSPGETEEIQRLVEQRRRLGIDADENQARRLISEMSEGKYGPRHARGAGPRMEADREFWGAPRTEEGSTFGPRGSSFHYALDEEGGHSMVHVSDHSSREHSPKIRMLSGGQPEEEGPPFEIDPAIFRNTIYASDVRLAQLLSRKGDWQGLATLKENLVQKMSNDTTTVDKGERLYDAISQVMEPYERRMRNREVLDHDDPRRHFTTEQINEMLKTNAEGDQAREYFFNRLFSQADTQPSRPFQEVFSQFYLEPKYNAFIKNLQQRGEELVNHGRETGNIAEQNEGKKLVNAAQRYILEYTYRGLIHDANYLIQANLGVEQMSGFMGRFSAEMLDHAFRKKGVTPAMHFYEQALLKVMAENNGYLPYDQVVAGTGGGYSRVETLARKYFDDALDRGFMKTKDGTVLTHKNMKYWEVDRAMAFARGLGIITARFVEIAATSRLPKNKYISMWAHVLIGSLSPMKHAIGKFDVGKRRNKFLLKKMDVMRKNWDYEEIDVDDDFVSAAINGMLPDDNQRYIGRTNPWGIGGLLSVSTWREAGEPGDETNLDPQANVPRTSAIGGFIERKEFQRIGASMIIEKWRKILANPEKKPAERQKAEEIIRKQLIRIAKMNPTKIIFNTFEAQDELRRYFKFMAGGKDAFLNEGFRNALDKLIVIQEQVLHPDRNGRYPTSLDFNIPPGSKPEDVAAIKMAEQIANFINNQYGENGASLDHLIEDFRDRKWKIPYIFGTDDIPWDEYEFLRTGGRTVDRKWKDLFNSTKASDALGELVNAMPRINSPADLIGALHKIHAPIEAYDNEAAEEAITDIAEGLIWFYYKESGSRGVLGEIKGKITGKASFAEMAFRRGQMSWDELQTHDFINSLKENDMINEHQRQHLMSITKAEGKHVLKRSAEYMLYIILLAILVRSTTQAFKSSTAA